MTNPPTPPSGSEQPERPAPVEHAHALPAGTVIEGYRIERLLGEGGFGLTYYAIEEAIDRPVAIKEYLPIGIGARDHQSLAVMPVSEERGADFEWGLERFRKEAATLVQFEHPNIVSIHRYFEALGTAYLVMPFIEGVSLEDIIKRLGHVPEAELRVIVDPLLDGLEEIHKADYLHRDIKPANIVMRPDGTPVLIDFGAARRFRNSNTVPLTSILTEGFAPLEQYQPDSEQGPWTDIYALGAVLYMCVSGERPMSATTRVEALAMDKPDPMDSAAASCVGSYSPALLAAIDAALHLSREERPQTVAAFRAMLDGANPPAQAAPAPTALPVGPDGAPLPPPQVSPAAQARPGRTIRISDEDRVFPSAEPAQGNVDTLALETPEERRARRLRSPRTLALSALLVAVLAGGGYAAWRMNDGPAPDPAAAADTGSDASADATAATALAKAGRSLASAKAALRSGDYRQAATATAAALRQARASLEAKPGSQRAKILIAEIAG
ncbi:MAG: serine/threonine-protein kinase, partial [Bauldia litoralis]